MPIVQKRIKIDNHSILYDLKVAKNVKEHIRKLYIIPNISLYRNLMYAL